jgi:hypothetical protein
MWEGPWAALLMARGLRDHPVPAVARVVRRAARDVAGALIGLAATAVTGLLLAFVLALMVGATVRTMQGAGWPPIHSIDAGIPYWLGVFPTVETLGAQGAGPGVRDRLVLRRRVRAREATAPARPP